MRRKVELKVEANQEEEMPRLNTDTAMIRDTRSGNVVSGKRKRVKRRSSKNINKTMIVTVILVVLLQQLRGL